MLNVDVSQSFPRHHGQIRVVIFRAAAGGRQDRQTSPDEGREIDKKIVPDIMRIVGCALTGRCPKSGKVTGDPSR